jgi:hypothetical protein
MLNKIHHIGYLVDDAAGAYNTNAISQQALYFDPNTRMGSRMHLTQLPASRETRRVKEAV